MNFKYYTVLETSNVKGKPFTCRSCKFQFRILEEEDRLNWKNLNYICPECKKEYCILPSTESELRILQDKFLSSRDTIHIGELYSLIKIYSRSLILKNFTNVVNDPDEIEYHSHSSAFKVIEQYYNREDFKIEISFAGYIVLKIKESIWHKSEKNVGDLSIDERDKDDKYKYETSSLCSIMIEKEKTRDSKDFNFQLYNYLIILIYRNGDVSFKLLLALLNFIREGEKGSDRIFEKFDIQGKHIFSNILKDFKKKLFSGVS
jgi:hypothetical protein